MPDYPYSRWLVYSEPMTGKSTFAAKFPKPMLVASFDPFLKESPYLEKGYYDEPLVMEDGTPYRDITDAEGTVLIRVVYFHDENPERPTAHRRFMGFMHTFDATERRQWQTFVLDSTSSLSRAILFYQMALNKDYKDPRKWHAEVADVLDLLMTRWASWRDINLLLLCHIDNKTDEAGGGMIRTVKMPGRHGRNGPDSVPEVYRLYVDPKTKDRLLQTARRNDSWLAGSQHIGAPDPCVASYGALWVNWSDKSRKPRPVGGVDVAGASAAPMDVLETGVTNG